MGILDTIYAGDGGGGTSRFMRPVRIFGNIVIQAWDSSPPPPTSLPVPKRGFRESQLAAHKDEDRGWMQVKLVLRVIRAGVNPGLKRSQFPLDTYSNFITALTALTTSCSCSCICARALCVTRYCIWQIHGAASPRERPSGRVNDAAHALAVETTTANTDKKQTRQHTHINTHLFSFPSSLLRLLPPFVKRSFASTSSQSARYSARVSISMYTHTHTHLQSNNYTLYMYFCVKQYKIIFPLSKMQR